MPLPIGMDFRLISGYWARMHWLDGPPGRVFHALWLVALVIILLDASVPASRRGPTLFAMFWIIHFAVLLRTPGTMVRLLSIVS